MIDKTNRFDINLSKITQIESNNLFIDVIDLKDDKKNFNSDKNLNIVEVFSNKIAVHARSSLNKKKKTGRTNVTFEQAMLSLLVLYRCKDLVRKFKCIYHWIGAHERFDINDHRSGPAREVLDPVSSHVRVIDNRYVRGGLGGCWPPEILFDVETRRSGTGNALAVRRGRRPLGQFLSVFTAQIKKLYDSDRIDSGVSVGQSGKAKLARESRGEGETFCMPEA